MGYLLTLVKIDQWSQREKLHTIVTLPLCFHLPNSFDLFLIFGGHQSFCRATDTLIWTSGDICPGFQSQSGFLCSHASSPVCNIFLRFMSGVTPADPLGSQHCGWVISINLLVYNHWWGSGPGLSMPLPHSMWQDRHSTEFIWKNNFQLNGCVKTAYGNNFGVNKSWKC